MIPWFYSRRFLSALANIRHLITDCPDRTVECHRKLKVHDQITVSRKVGPWNLSDEVFRLECQQVLRVSVPWEWMASQSAYHNTGRGVSAFASVLAVGWWECAGVPHVPTPPGPTVASHRRLAHTPPRRCVPTHVRLHGWPWEAVSEGRRGLLGSRTGDRDGEFLEICQESFQLVRKIYHGSCTVRNEASALNESEIRVDFEPKATQKLLPRT